MATSSRATLWVSCCWTSWAKTLSRLASCSDVLSSAGGASMPHVLVGFLVTFQNDPGGSFWPIHSGHIQLGRSAGTSIRLMAKDGDMATLRLPSGEMRLVRAECRATIGTIGNSDHQNVKIGKAGRKRHMGVRPQTRGTAMNPVDHPHGGGEGSTTPGRHPVTPWGVPTLGYRTRKKGKTSDRYVVRGRRRGKKR